MDCRDAICSSSKSGNIEIPDRSSENLRLVILVLIDKNKREDMRGSKHNNVYIDIYAQVL